MTKREPSFRGEYGDLYKLALRRGWSAVKIKSGVLLRSPDGVTSTVIHHSPSDQRGIRNLRADLRRGGIHDV